MSNAPRVVSGTEVLAPASSWDYIVPFTYSSNVEIHPPGELNVYLSELSRIAIGAATKAWEASRDAQIVIAGETCYGEDLPSTTDLMIEEARWLCDIPDDSLVPINELSGGRHPNNTYLQVEALAEVFTPQDEVLIVPMNYHLQRVMMASQAYGLKADYVSAERVLGAAGINSHWEYSLVAEQMQASERVLRLINRIDKRGKLLNLMTSIRGPRLVDIEEDHEGELQLVKGYTRKKARKLRSHLPKPKINYYRG